MIRVRKAADRFHTEAGWLDSRHTFSFAEHYSPEHMGFRALRVINDDRVRPGYGFPMHPHQDMEIVTYVLSGELEHKDSTGSAGVLRPGEVQRMSAGTGVLHSEMNPSRTEPVHLLQIWILPERRGLPPGYEQRPVPPPARGGLRLLGAREPEGGAVEIHQDVSLYSAQLGNGDRVTHRLAPGRHAWVQMARGAASLNGVRLDEGDGAAVSGEKQLELVGLERGEALVFDLA